jgi:hypothetical protein
MDRFPVVQQAVEALDEVVRAVHKQLGYPPTAGQLVVDPVI